MIKYPESRGQREYFIKYKRKGSDNMMDKAKQIVVDYYNGRVDKTDSAELTIDDVFVVWFCKTLGNWKVLVSTTVSDGMYYEVTHNGERNETYLDAYKKWENKCIK